MIAILFAEEVHDAGLVVVHPPHVALAPLVKVKVFHALDLVQSVKSILKFASALHGKQPQLTPFGEQIANFSILEDRLWRSLAIHAPSAQ